MLINGEFGNFAKDQCLCALFTCVSCTSGFHLAHMEPMQGVLARSGQSPQWKDQSGTIRPVMRQINPSCSLEGEHSDRMSSAAPGFTVNYSSSSCTESCPPSPSCRCLCCRSVGHVAVLMAWYLSPLPFSLPPTNPTHPPVPSPGAKLSAQAPLSLSRNAAGDAPHFRCVTRTCACGAGSDVLPHLCFFHHDLSLCFSSWLVITVIFIVCLLSSQLISGEDDEQFFTRSCLLSSFFYFYFFIFHLCDVNIDFFFPVFRQHICPVYISWPAINLHF